MSMSCSRLLSLSLSCASSLNSHRLTVSSHVDTFLKKEKLDGPDDQESASTIREIVYGLQRYKKILSLTVDGLFAKYVAQIARSDRTLYEVFTLLALFKLEELGLAEFRLFVLSQEAHKMHCLLSFLFTPEMQDGWLRDQWSTIYDPTHVENVLLGGLRKVGPQMTALISELGASIAHASANGTSSSSSSSSDPIGVTKVPRKESTVPEPFSLTQPKVKMLPAPPVQMDAVYKASPIPAPTPSLKELEQAKEARRKETLERIESRKTRAPKLATDQRALTTHTSSQRLKADLAAASRVIEDGAFTKAHPPPVLKDVAPAKATIATILREDLLYKKRLEEKAAELAKFESELRDEDDFHAWQLKMESLDDAAREAEIQRRKDLSKQSAIDAVKAMVEAASEKHRIVVEMREDLRVLNEKNALEKEKVQQRNKIQVEKVREDKQAIPIAIQEVIATKTKKAEEIVLAKVAGEKQLKKEASLDIARKKQLIREIQAMEKLAAVRAKRPKEIDPTTTSGYGFLDEMSLVELQSRLATLAEREELYLKEKRTKILQDKSRKSLALQEMQRTSAIMRGEKKKEFIASKTQRLVELTVERMKAETKLAADSELLHAHLANTAEQKRAEALRLVKELKSKKIQNEFYALTKVQLAQEREEDLEKARQRTIALAEANKVDLDKKAALEAYTAEKNRLRVERQKKREREHTRMEADDILKQHRRDHEELMEEDRKLKRIQHREIKMAVKEQIREHRAANPYAKSIADREARRAARLPQHQQQQHDDGINGADEAGFLASIVMADREERNKIRMLDGDGTDEEREEPEERAESTTHVAADPTITDPSAAPAAPASSALDAVRASEAALAKLTLKKTNSKAQPSSAKSTARATAAAAKTTKKITAQPLAARA